MGIDTRSVIFVGYDYETIEKLREEYCGPYADELEELYDWDQMSPYYDSDYADRAYGITVASSTTRLDLFQYENETVDALKNLLAKWGVEASVFVGAHVF